MKHAHLHWFQRVLQGRTDAPRLYKREDQRDWDFEGAAADPALVEDACATWKREIAKADEWLDSIAEADLGSEVAFDDGSVATRDVLVHRGRPQQVVRQLLDHGRHRSQPPVLSQQPDHRVRFEPLARVAGATGHRR